MAACIKSALCWRRRGYTYDQIRRKVAEELKLESVPHYTTVANWIASAQAAVERDIRELAVLLRHDQFTELEAMKQKFLAIATADGLEIQRWKMQDGDAQPVLDENAMDEQIKAAKVVVAIMERQAKLMNLDLTDTEANKAKEGMSFSELQVWMANNAASHNAKPINGEIVEAETPMDRLDRILEIPPRDREELVAM